MRYFGLVVLLFSLCDVHAEASNRWCLRLFGHRANSQRCCRQIATPCVVRTPIVEAMDPNDVVESNTGDQKASDSQKVDFAEMADQIRSAKSISFTVTPYMSFTSKDGEQTWLEARPRSEMIYQAPNFYRDTKYDPNGDVMLVQLVDTANQRFLTLNMKSKMSIPMKQAINVYDPDEPNPLGALVKSLAENPPEWVEKREVDGTTVDVFRYVRKPRGTTMDIWVDSAKNQIVAISQPGSDQLDLSQVLSKDEAPGRRERGRGRMAGMVRSEITINPDYDPELFQFEVPEGFQEMDPSNLPGGPVIVR